MCVVVSFFFPFAYVGLQNRIPVNLSPSMPPPAPTPAGGQFFGAELKNPLETPSMNAAHVVASNAVDKLEAEGLRADLDFYGTNEGLIYYGSGGSQSSEQRENDEVGASRSISNRSLSLEQNLNEHGNSIASPNEREALDFEENFAACLGVEEFQARIIRRLRERTASQESYIAELEDENMHLRKSIIGLRRRLDTSQKPHCSIDVPATGATVNEIDGIQHRVMQES